MGFYSSHVVPRLIGLAMRNRELLPYRERVASNALGRVLEIGVGSGLNGCFYTDRVTELIGVDSHAKLLAMAARQNFRVPIRLILATAESLPLREASIDTILMTWTLCSIANVREAL